MADTTPPPKRVRITSPRRDARRRGERRSDAVELTEQTGLGEVYLTALLRAQLRLALAVGPVPVSWLVVGVVVYPVVYAAARLHVRQSERIERDFTDLMNRQQ